MMKTCRHRVGQVIVRKAPARPKNRYAMFWRAAYFQMSGLHREAASYEPRAILCDSRGRVLVTKQAVHALHVVLNAITRAPLTFDPVRSKAIVK
jgi:hypothetical protein